MFKDMHIIVLGSILLILFIGSASLLPQSQWFPDVVSPLGSNEVLHTSQQSDGSRSRFDSPQRPVQHEILRPDGSGSRFDSPQRPVQHEILRPDGSGSRFDSPQRPVQHEILRPDGSGSRFDSPQRPVQHEILRPDGSGSRFDSPQQPVQQEMLRPDGSGSRSDRHQQPVQQEMLQPSGSRSRSPNSQQAFQQEMLQAHNRYRARHCAPPLQLDDNLSLAAQNYAQRLVSTNGATQSRLQGVGQNLFTKSSSEYQYYVNGAEPTDSWYNGIRNYDFNQGGFSMDSGSFTQVVWKDSQQLGVAVAYTDDGRSAYIVAYYSPPGNFGNQYRRNVAPAEC